LYSFALTLIALTSRTTFRLSEFRAVSKIRHASDQSLEAANYTPELTLTITLVLPRPDVRAGRSLGTIFTASENEYGVQRTFETDGCMNVARSDLSRLFHRPDTRSKVILLYTWPDARLVVRLKHLQYESLRTFRAQDSFRGSFVGNGFQSINQSAIF